MFLPLPASGLRVHFAVNCIAKMDIDIPKESMSTSTFTDGGSGGGGSITGATDGSGSEHTHILTTADHHDITGYLIGANSDLLQKLGITLGISHYRLQNTQSPLFTDDMVALWLQRVDQVDQQGGPTWTSLEKAMRDKTVGMIGPANDIRRERLKGELDLEVRPVESSNLRSETVLQNQSQGHTQLLKMTWIKILVVGLLAVLLFWLYANNYLHLLFNVLLYQFKLLHSKSLPYLSANFVGREVEVREITDLVDFSNLHNQVISIVGPPGFGKSTLAIHIGHNMVHEGVIVHYIDMIEVSSMQSLAEKVLDSDNSIVAIRNITADRLFRWARERYHRTLLIFDNCDDIIHRQKDAFQKVLKKLIQSSQNLKILITSRHKTAQLDQFQYPLRELSTEASCNLLQSVADNLTVCESITNLTGNVPLALRVVSTLLSLPDSPDITIILASLEKALISTLSSEHFPVEERVNASISLSYQYLTPRLQKIGRHLAHFPGSFDQEAACKIMIRIASNRITCSDVAGFLNSLSERSLLEYSQRQQRYQFHQLIREFFLSIVKSSGDAGKNETRRFLISYQLHYTAQLQSLVVHEFSNSKSTLEKERHNILHLLRYTAESDIHLSAFTTIKNALISRLLNSRFTAKELLLPVKNMTNHLHQRVAALLDKKQVPSHILSYFELYVHFIDEYAELEEQVTGVSAAIQVFLSNKQMIELTSVHVERTEITELYIMFYRKLSEYYSKLKQHENAKRCHAKILKSRIKLVEETESFNYHSIGNIYYMEGDYENSAHFFQLALELESESTMEESELMIKLYKSYKKLHDEIEAKGTLEKLFALFPSVLAAPIPELYQHSEVVQELIELYRKNGKIYEATKLIKRLTKILLKIKEQHTILTLWKAYTFADYLHKVNSYLKATELAQFILSSLTHLDKAQQEQYQQLKTDTLLIIGYAKWRSGNVSEGLDYLELSANVIYEQNFTEYYDRILGDLCFRLIFRGYFGCFVSQTLSSFVLLAKVLVSFITSSLFNGLLDIQFDTDSTQTLPAQATQISHSKNIAVTTGDAPIIPVLLSKVSVSLLSFVFSSIMSTAVIAATTVISTVQWVLSFIVVRAVINVLWIWMKLTVTYSAIVTRNSSSFCSKSLLGLLYIVICIFCYFGILITSST